VYWACASLQQNRVELALHFLKLNGFSTYTPRIRVERKPGANGSALLFPGYIFISIELQWHRASRTSGVVKLIMDGEAPARVPDHVIASLRARERGGLITLPTRPNFQRGDSVRVVRGPFRDRLAIFQDMKARERVEVLLQLFGSERCLALPRRDILRS
jgi:transcriptional antiterminator RfaH